MSFSKAEYQQRLNKLAEIMAAKPVDLVIHTQNPDLYYYSGSVAPLYLVAPKGQVPFLLARKAVERIAADVAHLELEVFQGTRDLKAIFEKRRVDGTGRIGFALDSISYASVQRWLSILGSDQPVDISWELRAARMVKSEAEIAIQTRAGANVANWDTICRDNFQPGMPEIELSAALEHQMRIGGHAGLVRCHREGIEVGLGVCSAGKSALAGSKFDGVCVGSGMTAAVPYGASRKPIAPGEPVVLDYAFNLEGYHVDQTRMVIWGEPSPKIAKAYEAMRQVQTAAFELMKPGVSWSSIYEPTLALAVELGYEVGYMGLGPEKVRFLGHGIGLELDEPPFIAPNQEALLEEGMVIAIEPKVSIPEVGVIGIEDTVVIRRNGVEPLTRCPSGMIVLG